MDGLFDQAAQGFTSDPIIALGNVIALSYLIPLLLFIWRYWRGSPWWVTDLGVALMAQKIAFVGIFVLIDLGIFFHDWPLRAGIRFGLYAIVGLSFWLDGLNLARYQSRGHYDRAKFPRPPLWLILRAQFTGQDLTHWSPGAPSKPKG